MEINLTRNDKIELLKACQSGILNTAKISILNEVVENGKPARVLTKKEVKELIYNLENEY